MEQVPGLVATLLAHTLTRFTPPTAAEAAALDALLRRAWEEAHAQWPTVELPITQFVRHLAERLPKVSPDSPIAPLLARLAQADLYLACACLHGMASAHEAFERTHLARLPGLLRSLKQPGAMIDDACQITRVKLLVATPEGAPRIGDYTGSGALLSWVQVIAGRIVHRLRAAAKTAPDDSSEEIIQVLPGQGIDPELDVMKRRHHADFRQALREAASTLSAHERYLLRLRFADQLTTYELASLFRVDQSTISRWLKSARQRVYEETRSRLQERLGLSTPGFKSFLAFIGSQLDLNISQLLAEKGIVPPPTDG
jgi:RNA polymerase sigma-70 factor